MPIMLDYILLFEGEGHKELINDSVYASSSYGDIDRVGWVEVRYASVKYAGLLGPGSRGALRISM